MNYLYARLVGFLLWLFTNGKVDMKPVYLGKICDSCMKYPEAELCIDCKKMLEGNQ